jgi:hypothetical protein
LAKVVAVFQMKKGKNAIGIRIVRLCDETLVRFVHVALTRSVHVALTRSVHVALTRSVHVAISCVSGFFFIAFVRLSNGQTK